MSIPPEASSSKPRSIFGQCLCGSVEFEISGPLPDFYQCHCSLCRKLSGSGCDTATFLSSTHFQWVRGQDGVKSFKTESGYRSEFCERCGSTVPHLMDNGRQYWVPAGLLANVRDSRVVAHLFVSSKAAWDNVAAGEASYTEMPSMDELNAVLHRRLAAQRMDSGDV